MTDVLDRALLEPVIGPSETSDASSAGGGWVVEARALLRLAGPLVLTQLAQMAIMTTDLILLGRYSQTCLAAAALGGTVWFSAWLVGGGPAAAVSPMIAQHLGARPRHRGGVRSALRMGLWAVFLVSAAMIPVLLNARAILIAFHQAPELAALAGQFLGVLALGLPFSLAYQVLRNFSTALGRPQASLWVVCATIVLNGLLDWTLIFGHFGAPRLGILGSGLATASSHVFSCVAMVVLIHLDPKLRPYRIFRRFARPVGDKLVEVFRLGAPIGLTMIFEAMLFNTMTLVMGTFGAHALAAHQIAMNAASITFMVPLGLGMAATVRVGLFAGAGDREGVQRAGLVAFAIATGFMLVCAAVVFFDSRQIAGLYLGRLGAAGAATAALTAIYLKGAAAFQVFDGVQVVGAQALRGLKDARMPMILAGGSYWLVGAPVCLALAYGAHMQGLGVWIGFVAGLAAAAVAMSLRFWRLTRPPTGPAR
ncbi:MAG TPA: MATE family efflux transporter [Caulobacteraceae bacterium]|nr:MATE family efflux transporter [Caulobacteraceae bacterium]